MTSFQRKLLETYGMLTLIDGVARYTAFDVIEERKNGKIAEEAEAAAAEELGGKKDTIWDKARKAYVSILGEKTTHGSAEIAWNLFEEEMTIHVGKVIFDFLSASEIDTKQVGIISTKAAIKYAVANEEKMCRELSDELKKLEANVVEYEDVFYKLLLLDLTSMNVGLQCWFFAKLYNMSHCIGKSKLMEVISTEPRVSEFIDWMVGPSFSKEEFSREMCVYLIFPLAQIVYEFLAPPSNSLVVEEILTFI